MIKKILPDGSKTLTGIALMFSALLALIGIDIPGENVEVVIGAIGSIGGVLATYGRIDKENRSEAAVKKAKEIDVQDLLKEAKVILDNIHTEQS